MQRGRIVAEYDREKRKFKLTESAVLEVENLHY